METNMKDIANLYPVPESTATQAHIDSEQYQRLYKRSVDSPEEFWAEQAQHFLTWDRPWNQVCEFDFHEGTASWFHDGKLNASRNCIDRHLPMRAEQTAIIWEGDEPGEVRTVTYAELHLAVCKLANVLKERGVSKGDRVSIYMPVIPEAAIAMLACARIEAIHSVVFGGFSPEALKDRILDSDCRVIITADEGLRGGKRIPLKKNVDEALGSCPAVHTCLVVRRTGGEIAWKLSGACSGNLVIKRSWPGQIRCHRRPG
jgi:acetyl-CoA synthetase